MPTLEELNIYSNYAAAKRKIQQLGLDPNRLHVSDKPLKKYYYVRPDGHSIYFGAMGYQDFLKHKDIERRERFLIRNHKWAHAPKYTPAWFSFYVTW